LTSGACEKYLPMLFAGG